MQTQPFDGNAMTLHTLLSQQKAHFRVPEFQRNYVWTTTKELPRFWKYLTHGRTGDGAQPVFLGALVLHLIRDSDFSHPTHYHVIDGQQRLVTTFLFLAAIAECFQEIDDPDSAHNVETSYLLHNLSSYRDKPLISSSINDTKQFNKALRVLENPPLALPGDTGDTNGNLISAWEWIREKVRAFSNADGGESEKTAGLLSDLLNALVYQTWVGIITIRDQANAHQAFQRLNADGIRLTTIDLVRNAVFTTLTTTDSQKLGHFYATRWSPFENALGKRESDYWYSLALLRDRSTTRSGVFDTLQTRWLSDEFRKGRSGKALAEAIMDDLTEFVEAFQGVSGQQRPANLDTDSWRALSRLQRADLPTMTYAFFFQLINRRMTGAVTKDEFVLQCEIIESFVARRVLRGLEMNAVQATFKRLLSHEYTGKEMLEDLAGHGQLGTDEEVQQGVLSASLYDMKRRNFVLTEHERWQQGGKQLDPKGSNVFQVDRVMPDKYQAADWPDVTPEIHQQVVRTWGNLVLLSPPENIGKSAKGYSEARPKLMQPGQLQFRSTGRTISDFETWSPAAIEKRGESLGKWATMRWPSTMAGFQDSTRAARLKTAN